LKYVFYKASIDICYSKGTQVNNSRQYPNLGIFKTQIVTMKLLRLS